MTDKINGGISSGEHLGKNIDFWTCYTAHVLDTTGADVNSATPTSADSLDRIINFIGQRAQAVMVSVATAAGQTLTDAPQSLGTSYDAAGALYTLKFAVEHAGAWNDTASAVGNLEEAIHGLKLPITLDNSAQTAADTDLIDTDSATIRNTRFVKSLTL